MERRDFLKLASMTGLTVAVGSAMDAQNAQAEAAPAHTFFLNFAFMGGIDTTNFVDPKGAANETEAASGPDSSVMNRYLTSEIAQHTDSSSGVSWAPLYLSRELANNQAAIDNAMNFENFMRAYAKDLLVIRGIDIQTNAHDVGARSSVTGTAQERSAAFGAIVSAGLLPNAPMSFISFGGYSDTAGLTAVTRLGNLDAIKRLAYPYRRNPNNADELYFADEQAAMIADAREARFNEKFAQQKLPKLKNSLNTLYLSRLGQNELKQLVSYLPDDVLPGVAGQVQLAAAAYKAGLAVACNLSAPGGYDHHDNVDPNIANSLGNAFDPDQGIPRAIKVLEDLDLYGKKACITFTSDFGRTPGYNMGNGKDHWGITSMVLFGNINGKKIKPGIKGGTTERHAARGVDVVTGVVNDGTLNIHTGHIQNALRKLAGVADTPGARANPVPEPTSELPDLIELV
jgi:hypothetical protein